MNMKGFAVIALVAVIALAVAGFSALTWQKNGVTSERNGFAGCGSGCGCGAGSETAGAFCEGQTTTEVSDSTDGDANTIISENKAAKTKEVQDVYIRALANGNYNKPLITVKKGTLVRLHFTADRNAGCGRFFVLDEFNVKLLPKGEDESVAEFLPEKAGTYPYHCGMWMWKGKLVVE